MPLSTRVTFPTGGVRDAAVDHVARLEKANARSLAAQNEAAGAINATTAAAAIGGRRRLGNNVGAIINPVAHFHHRPAAATSGRARVKPLPSSASLVDHTPLERRNLNNAALAGLTDAQWQAYVDKERLHLHDAAVLQRNKSDTGSLQHARAPHTHLLNSGLGRGVSLDDGVEKMSARKQTITTPQELHDDTQLALSGSIDTEAASVLAQNAIYEAKWDRDQVLRHHQHMPVYNTLSDASEAAARSVDAQTTPSLAMTRARAIGPVERSTNAWREPQRQLDDFTEALAHGANNHAHVVMHHQHQFHLDPAALTMTAPVKESARDWSTTALEAAANRDARKMEADLIEQHKQANVSRAVGGAAFRTNETHLEGLAALRALEQQLARSEPIQRREVVFNATSMPPSAFGGGNHHSAMQPIVNHHTLHAAATTAVPARRYESTARAMGRDLERSGLMQLGLADKAARATRYESTAMAMGHDVEKSSTHFGKNDAARATGPSPFHRSHRRSWGAAEAGPVPLPEHVNPSMYVTENRASFRVPFQW